MLLEIVFNFESYQKGIFRARRPIQAHKNMRRQDIDKSKPLPAPDELLRELITYANYKESSTNGVFLFFMGDNNSQSYSSILEIHLNIEMIYARHTLSQCSATMHDMQHNHCHSL